MKLNYNKRTNNTVKSQQHVHEYDFFTGGGTQPFIDSSKTAALTIYYNIAIENIAQIEKELREQTEIQKNNFWAEYLWKAHTQSKNTSGYKLTQADKDLIVKLKKKAEEIRNYHSHIWHDNSVLECCQQLKEFIERKYAEAKARLYQQYPGSISDFENILKKNQGRYDVFDNRSRLKIEGRAFLLSFFLTTGQMNNFLQQRKGYKRNDLPMYKITRLIYSEYCHRDGAAKSSISHERHLLNTLEKPTQISILKARTAYKLISYLVDYPHYWGDLNYTPLLDSVGRQIKRIEQLKKFIEDYNLLPSLQFSLIRKNIVSNGEIIHTKHDHLKEYENKFRTGVIAFKHIDITGYTFHINFNTLYRLVLLKLLPFREEDNILTRLTTELHFLAEQRRMLFEILKKPANTHNSDEIDFLLTKKNQYLRGGRLVTSLGIEYFEKVEKLNERFDEAINLANFLRDENSSCVTRFDGRGYIKPEPAAEPIQIYQHDLILGEREKFRSGNRFVFYMSKYLIDFAGDEWYWCHETFSNDHDQITTRLRSVKKKSYFKASEIPLDQDYRLTVDNNHVFLAITKNEVACTNHDRFYQFSLGEKAMRYLAAYMINNKDYGSKIGLFLRMLADDINILKNKSKFNSADEYELLEDKFISSFMKCNDHSYEQLISKFIKRVEHIERDWDSALENIEYLTRAEKNRMVMNAYRLFDWASDRSDGKFLRANEYKELSICHHCLHVRRNDFNKSNTMTFERLFYEQFDFSKRQPPIPIAVKELLFKANGLDDLLQSVIADRRLYLRSKVSLPIRFLKKELPELCRRIGISVPGNLMNENAQRDLSEKHQVTFDVLPYSIHPMLLFKFFFKDKYMEGKKMEEKVTKSGETVKVRPGVDVFKDVRKNNSLKSNLSGGYYDTGLASKLYSEGSSPHSKLFGLINTTLTEDIMLWWMAKSYLEDNEYTNGLAELLKKNQGIKIDDLYKISVNLQLKKEGSDPLNRPLLISLRMHQFDDMMFFTDRQKLRKAGVHFLKRCNEELSLWSNEMQHLNESQFNGEGLPDGTITAPIPYWLLREEIDFVRRTGQKLAHYMLTFEKMLFQEMLFDSHNGNKEQFHAWLLNEFQNHGKQGTKPYFSFEKSLELLNENQMNVVKSIQDSLTEYRNMAFHDDIPLNGSYSWFSRRGQQVRNFLNVNEDLHLVKDKSAYLNS